MSSSFIENRNIVQLMLNSSLEAIYDWDDGKTNLYNLDYHHLNSYAWYPKYKLSNEADRYSYAMIRKLEMVSSSPRYKIVLSRSALFELLVAISREIEKIDNIKQNDGFDNIDRVKLDDFLKSHGKMTGKDSANEIEKLYYQLPSSLSNTNINNIAKLLRTGKIVSFHDVLDRKEVIKCRNEINELSELLLSDYYKRSRKNQYEIAAKIDCRNIATSMVLNRHFENTIINFVGPSHAIRIPEFTDIRRSYLVPAITIQAVQRTKFEFEVEGYLKRFATRANEMFTELQKCKDYDDFPSYFISDLEAFYQEIDMLGTIDKIIPDKNIYEMREKIAGYNIGKVSFDEKIEKSRDNLQKSAKSIIEGREIDIGILDDLDLADNDRAKMVLKKLGI